VCAWCGLLGPHLIVILSRVSGRDKGLLSMLDPYVYMLISMDLCVVCMRTCVCVGMCMCVCVCERERERERENQDSARPHLHFYHAPLPPESFMLSSPCQCLQLSGPFVI
jgi:hypothetical protein